MLIKKRKSSIFHCLFGIDDAILGGVLGLAGDLFGASMAQDAQSSAIEANMLMQQKNIDWEKEQLTNKHQWEVSDLRKAGLNPILSATNGSSAVSAGTPSATPVKPEFQLSRTLEAISHSALMKKQQESVDFQNQTERIKADAEMLRARMEEERNASAIAVNESTSGLQVKQTEMLDKNYELQKAYTEANVREIDQRIINSVAEVKAKIQYLHDSGQAALMSASAAQASAQAALQNAASQRIIAEVARENGISQRALNDALQGKASEETKEAMARTQSAYKSLEIKDWQLSKDRYHNPGASNAPVSIGNLLLGAGEIIRNGWNPSNLLP